MTLPLAAIRRSGLPGLISGALCEVFKLGSDPIEKQLFFSDALVRLQQQRSESKNEACRNRQRYQCIRVCTRNGKPNCNKDQGDGEYDNPAHYPDALRPDSVGERAGVVGRGRNRPDQGRLHPVTLVSSVYETSSGTMGKHPYPETGRAGTKDSTSHH
jgi:hypothetical protein